MRPLTLLRDNAPWVYWALWFLAAWVVVVTVGGYWQELPEHWPAALAMLFGSYFAGSTPIGGGAVGFPVLVLALDEPVSLGRHFALAIQAVGMSSASILILTRRHAIAWGVLGWSLAASALATPLSYVFLAPLVSGPVVKLAFAVIWAGFGMLTLARLESLLRDRRPPASNARLDLIAGLLVGVLGGVASSLTGVGINMVMYVVLVLVYRSDLRVAIPTAVISMAVTAVYGTVTAAAMGALERDLLGHWLAAAPVVLFGAPLGAIMVRVLHRKPTLLVVSVLCLAQLVWTCVEIKAGPVTIGVLIAIALAMAGMFFVLDLAGRRLQEFR